MTSATPIGPLGGAIVGWGTALPPAVVTNNDLAQRLDTTDEWIVERTGIRARRIGGTTASLAATAGRDAMDKANVAVHEVDLLLLTTTTPDVTVPATAVLVQEKLGLTCPAFDINAACAGFVYGVVTAHSFLAIGYQRVLLIGAETLSRITDPADRATAVLLGDGAAAVILERSSKPHLLAWELGTDSTNRPLLQCELGGFLQMQGREVFREAVLAASDSIMRVLKDADFEAVDVSLFVPHQANLRMLEAIAENVGLSMDSTAIVLDRVGNTSAASIPLALAHAADSGRLRSGDIVLLAGFGAGLSWGTALLRWA